MAPSHEAFTELDPPIVGTDLQQRKRGLCFASLHRFPDFPPRPTFSPDLFLTQPGSFQGTLGQEAGEYTVSRSQARRLHGMAAGALVVKRELPAQ